MQKKSKKHSFFSAPIPFMCEQYLISEATELFPLTHFTIVVVIIFR